MASSQHVEMEAAKFLHKLIQESKDEPAKLATKLYVICQHMKMSGKEQSLPYQVISRAMETVISQHRLDIEALKSSHLSLGTVPQMGDSRLRQTAGNAPESSVGFGMAQKQTGISMWHSTQTSVAKDECFNRTAPNYTSQNFTEATGPSDTAKTELLRSDLMYRGPPTQSPKSGKSLEHESSTSLPMEDSRSGNSQERHNSAASDVQAQRKKKSNAKRKRAESKESSEILGDDPQQSDSASTLFNSLKSKPSGRTASLSLRPVKGGENSLPGLQQTAQREQGSEIRRQFKDTADTKPVPIPNTEKITKEVGEATTSQPSASNMPFKEHHLKQLRAQCLVFLAFRNNVPPRKLHLEIALGERYPKEDGNHQGSIEIRGKSMPSQEHGHNPESAGSLTETESSSKNADTKNQNTTLVEVQRTEVSQLNAETRGLLKSQVESESPTSAAKYFGSNQVHQSGSWVNQHLPSSLKKNSLLRPELTLPCPSSIVLCSTEQDKAACIGASTIKHTNSEFPIIEASVVGNKSSTPFTIKAMENLTTGLNRLRDIHDEKLQNVPELNGQKTSEIMKQTNSGMKTVIYDDTSRGGTFVQATERLTEGDDESSSIESDELHVSPPEFTTSEKWIFEERKKRRVEEEKWSSNQRKAGEQIALCFEKLKESVNASENISAKTKSVIELKKIQLLQIQRRLRSDFLRNFFKPISSEMEHLKSIKKYRHGRKIKQLERFEQKMKEERQKRIRDREKDFFGELEAHKEKVEDFFKIKRERCKGIHRYVKEFHKRKERIYREKIDRIQREKINLLKANDVEGYLRMVQDAKSDRVKQLLKETEKYLQKLGAKIQDAKSAARLFGGETDASDVALSEKSEAPMDLEDESDQAQHYLESNEKYYLMAHSVKENIEEQPVLLRGGKLREYQMNGLRWLVSLYNNHLNGILADEMGLGKTVQVISLICYLIESKNDRGPFLVVVPSSVLPGWESEINFWAPGINKIKYAGSPEERRRLFKERIAHQKFNVLLTTYEYLMNKHDRPKLSKIDWHYVIIDEGHRIKNASCKLNADLKHYRSNHRLLLTGTPLQNNLEELWALLNFLLPNIFNSAEDFSQWFNKPFQSNNDNAPDQALLSEEENLLIINRLHQVLRPFVLRRLKHKVENELPEKIERLVRCEPSAYQKLLMKRVEDNLGSIGASKGRTVHNTVMELRNICNHPYLSQLHSDEVEALLPKHYLPPLVRLCGKIEMVDRLLPKLKATGHRVLFFSTMTRLLDVMEEYLQWKHYRYLRLDGHTSGGDRGALIEEFNRPDSSTFIFLLSIRAGGVGVNLQAADTVIIFDTDWNPQVDLQAQARAHRIGQKRDVLVLRLETVNSVEEQVRAAAEHKLGVANQSITAGFFDNNTSAEDRREYLESLLRECKKEEAAPVLDDDALNDILARSESEIDVFETVDRYRREQESAIWQKLTQEPSPMPPRLVTDEDLEPLYKALRILEAAPPSSVKRKGDVGLDTQHYGRGKRSREVRSYEDQWTEEEFEKLCRADSPGSSSFKVEESLIAVASAKDSILPKADDDNRSLPSAETPSGAREHSMTLKRGRGRPKRPAMDTSEPSDPTSSQEMADIDAAKGSGEGAHGRGKKSSVSGSAASLGRIRIRKNNSETQRGPTLITTKDHGLLNTEESLKLKADTSQAVKVLNVAPENDLSGRRQYSKVLSTAMTVDSGPASVRPVLEKKVSVTSKKAAAREARKAGNISQETHKSDLRSTTLSKSKSIRLKRTLDGGSRDVGISGVTTLLSQKKEHKVKTQESSSKTLKDVKNGEKHAEFVEKNVAGDDFKAIDLASSGIDAKHDQDSSAIVPISSSMFRNQEISENSEAFVSKFQDTYPTERQEISPVDPMWSSQTAQGHEKMEGADGNERDDQVETCDSRSTSDHQVCEGADASIIEKNQENLVNDQNQDESASHVPSADSTCTVKLDGYVSGAAEEDHSTRVASVATSASEVLSVDHGDSRSNMQSTATMCIINIESVAKKDSSTTESHSEDTMYPQVVDQHINKASEGTNDASSAENYPADTVCAETVVEHVIMLSEEKNDASVVENHPLHATYLDDVSAVESHPVDAISVEDLAENIIITSESKNDVSASGNHPLDPSYADGINDAPSLESLPADIAYVKDPVLRKITASEDQNDTSVSDGLASDAAYVKDASGSRNGASPLENLAEDVTQAENEAEHIIITSEGKNNASTADQHPEGATYAENTAEHSIISLEGRNEASDGEYTVVASEIRNDTSENLSSDDMCVENAVEHVFISSEGQNAVSASENHPVDATYSENVAERVIITSEGNNDVLASENHRAGAMYSENVSEHVIISSEGKNDASASENHPAEATYVENVAEHVIILSEGKNEASAPENCPAKAMYVETVAEYVIILSEDKNEAFAPENHPARAMNVENVIEHVSILSEGKNEASASENHPADATYTEKVVERVIISSECKNEPSSSENHPEKATYAENVVQYVVISSESKKEVSSSENHPADGMYSENVAEHGIISSEGKSDALASENHPVDAMYVENVSEDVIISSERKNDVSFSENNPADATCTEHVIISSEGKNVASASESHPADGTYAEDVSACVIISSEGRNEAPENPLEDGNYADNVAEHRVITLEIRGDVWENPPSHAACVENIREDVIVSSGDKNDGPDSVNHPAAENAAEHNVMESENFLPALMYAENVAEYIRDDASEKSPSDVTCSENATQHVIVSSEGKHDGTGSENPPADVTYAETVAELVVMASEIRKDTTETVPAEATYAETLAEHVVMASEIINDTTEDSPADVAYAETVVEHVVVASEIRNDTSERPPEDVTYAEHVAEHMLVASEIRDNASENSSVDAMYTENASELVFSSEGKNVITYAENQPADMTNAENAEKHVIISHEGEHDASENPSADATYAENSVKHVNISSEGDDDVLENPPPSTAYSEKATELVIVASECKDDVSESPAADVSKQVIIAPEIRNDASETPPAEGTYAENTTDCVIISSGIGNHTFKNPPADAMYAQNGGEHVIISSEGENAEDHPADATSAKNVSDHVVIASEISYDAPENPSPDAMYVENAAEVVIISSEDKNDASQDHTADATYAGSASEHVIISSEGKYDASKNPPGDATCAEKSAEHVIISSEGIIDAVEDPPADATYAENAAEHVIMTSEGKIDDSGSENHVEENPAGHGESLADRIIITSEIRNDASENHPEDASYSESVPEHITTLDIINFAPEGDPADPTIDEHEAEHVITTSDRNNDTSYAEEMVRYKNDALASGSHREDTTYVKDDVATCVPVGHPEDAMWIKAESQPLATSSSVDSLEQPIAEVNVEDSFIGETTVNDAASMEVDADQLPDVSRACESASSSGVLEEDDG
ncbi:uncharacterized protein LOC144705318 [Wolffia australiana]